MSKYKIATALIINDRGEILLSKRARDPFKGKWALVSGIGASKIHNLPPEKGVIEEVRADLGTQSFVGEYFFSIPLKHDPEVDENVVFLGKINENEINLNPKYSEGIKWVSLKNEEAFKDLAFESEQIIGQYLSNHKK